MNNVPAVRCFIALEIPDDIRAYLHSLTGQLRSSGADVKWVERQNIHLTVKFLGACPPQQVQAVMSHLNELSGKYQRIEASLDRLGAFPSAKSPKVIWAGLLLPDGSLQQLQQEIEHRMEASGFARGNRRFAPHLTLGRVRSERKAGALTGLLQRMVIEHRVFIISSLVLMKSELSPQGPSYHPLLTIGLA